MIVMKIVLLVRVIVELVQSHAEMEILKVEKRVMMGTRQTEMVVILHVKLKMNLVQIERLIRQHVIYVLQEMSSMKIISVNHIVRMVQ